MNPRLIGPAGQLAHHFARIADEQATVKLLFTGQPGTGKTTMANQIAAALCGGPWGIESANGRDASIHLIREWKRECATSCMFGSGWRTWIINEVDTCPADTQDALLTFLDELPANCCFIGTSNLDVDRLSERFRTRLERHEVGAPAPEEVAQLLVQEGVPEAVARGMAFLAGGNVRAALIDGRAWLGKHKPAVRVAKPQQQFLNVA